MEIKNSKLAATMARIQANIERAAKAKHDEIQADSRHELIENVVTKSNALCRAYYRFNLVEKRVMESMISQLDSRLFKYQTQEVELKAVDYAKAFGVTEKSAYRELEGALDALLHRVITVEQDNRIIKRPLMFRADYYKGEGRLVASFHPELIGHLIGLRKKFASYPLADAVEFKSSYTWRFYELMVSWAQDKKLTGGLLAGWFTVEVDEFKNMMGAPKSFQWVHVKERIIERSQQELLETANIHLEAEYIKKGRKITHIKFQFMEDEQQQLKLEG